MELQGLAGEAPVWNHDCYRVLSRFRRVQPPPVSGPGPGVVADGTIQQPSGILEQPGILGLQDRLFPAGLICGPMTRESVTEVN